MQRPIKPDECRDRAQAAIDAEDPATAAAYALLSIACDLAVIRRDQRRGK